MMILLSSALIFLCCSLVRAQSVAADAQPPASNHAAIVKECKLVLAQKHSKKERYEILLKLSRTYADAGNSEKAVEFCQEAITLFPKKEDAHLLVAQVYQHNELYELARQEFVTVLRYNRKSFNASFAMAQLYLQQGLMTQAMEYFRKAMAIQPTTELYRAMAQCAENSGDLDLSITLLQQAIFREERYDDLLHLGNLYEQGKNFTGAEKSISRAIEIDPGRVEGYLAAGLVHLRNNNLPLAEHFLRIAQDKAPKEGSIHFFLAVLSFHRGNRAEAMKENAQAMWLSRTDILTAYTYKFDHFLASREKKH